MSNFVMRIYTLYIPSVSSLTRLDLTNEVIVASKEVNHKIIKGVAVDIDHRLMKQQYTSLLPFNGIKGGRKTSCITCQQKKKKLIWRLVIQPYSPYGECSLNPPL